MKKKIFVRGPVLSQSGYGEQSRFALRALRSREDLFDIYIQPTPWGQTGWVWENSEFRQWIDERISITATLIQQKQIQPDISLQITIPNEFQKICPVNIGYTAGIETTKVAPEWLQKGNDMDKILVVSQHAKDSYVNTVAQAKNFSDGNKTHSIGYHLNNFYTDYVSGAMRMKIRERKMQLFKNNQNSIISNAGDSLTSLILRL